MTNSKVRVERTDDASMRANANIPNRADAGRAATLLVSAGVSRVMLFGSVARGEASEESDIDLVAIYDDLDYSERFARKQELSRLVEADTGHPVDLLVTDRPEWKVRTEDVVTSLESRVAGYGVVLADRGAGEVDWDKAMVLPTHGYEAAVRRLREVISALTALHMFLKPDDPELEARHAGDIDEALYLQVIRFEGACRQAQRAVEPAIKALVHLACHRRELRAHDIGELCSQLVEPYRSDVAARIAAVGSDRLTRRHEDSRYIYERPAEEPPSGGLVRAMAAVACGVATYAAEQIGGTPIEISLVRQAAMRVERSLNRCKSDHHSPLTCFPDLH